MPDNKTEEYELRWIKKPEQKGEFLFTFDGKRVYNLFRDYPHELTPEQKKVFDSENPFWAAFFNGEEV